MAKVNKSSSGYSCVFLIGLSSLLIVSLGIILSILVAQNGFDDNHIDFHFEEVPCAEVHHSAKLFKGMVSGAESMAFVGEGKIISGMVDGRVMELDINENTAKTLFQVKNSRPLGVRIMNETILGVADAMLGFYLYDIKTEKKVFFIKSGDLVDNSPVVFLDDFAYSSKRNVLYISQASTKYGYHELLPLLMHGGAHGRILTYDLNSGKVGILGPKLAFPNGLELSKDENSLFINELQRFSTLKFDLNSNTFTTFTTYPGYPDNIKSDGAHGYWVAVNSVNQRQPYYLEKYPFLRALLYFSLKYQILGPDVIIKSYGSFLHIDQNGKIDRCFCSSDGSTFNQVTEVAERNGMLFIGSFLDNVDYIAQLKMENLD